MKLPSKILMFALLWTAVPLQASADKKVVLFLGDSITAGYGVDLSKAYPSLIQEKISAAKLPYRVANAGVSGDTTAGGLARVNWALREKPSVLVIALGGNDGLRGVPIATTRENMQKIIDRARAKVPGIVILVAGMQMPPNFGETYTKSFAAIYPEIARKNKTLLIPFLLEGVGGKIELNQPDRIHPTEAGHKIVAENVWSVLKTILRP